MAGLSLFEERDLDAPALRLGTEAMKARLIAAYAKELLANPPVRSLVPNPDVEESERERLARTYAKKDIERVFKVLIPAGLELSDRGRTATLKALLADWLRASDEDAASGGNGSESVDVDELERRTREALHV